MLHIAARQNQNRSVCCVKKELSSTCCSMFTLCLCQTKWPVSSLQQLLLLLQPLFRELRKPFLTRPLFLPGSKSKTTTFRYIISIYFLCIDTFQRVSQQNRQARSSSNVGDPAISNYSHPACLFSNQMRKGVFFFHGLSVHVHKEPQHWSILRRCISLVGGNRRKNDLICAEINLTSLKSLQLLQVTVQEHLWSA